MTGIMLIGTELNLFCETFDIGVVLLFGETTDVLTHLPALNYLRQPL